MVPTVLYSVLYSNLAKVEMSVALLSNPFIIIIIIIIIIINYNLTVQANDEILEINGQDTQDMMHHDAINQIRYGGNSVKLVIRRGTDFEQGRYTAILLANRLLVT